MKRKHLKGEDLSRYSFEHTKQRMLERYGLNLTLDDYNLLCNNVRNRKNVIEVDRENQKDCTQIIFETYFKSKTILVVYEDVRDCITTVLPNGDKQWAIRRIPD